MAHRDVAMLPQEFLQLMVTLRRGQLRIPGPGAVVTVVDGCTGYLLRSDEARPAPAGDAASQLAAWPAPLDAASQ